MTTSQETIIDISMLLGIKLEMCTHRWIQSKAWNFEFYDHGKVLGETKTVCV